MFMLMFSHINVIQRSTKIPNKEQWKGESTQELEALLEVATLGEVTGNRGSSRGSESLGVFAGD